jgi:hypothetical protein
MTRDVLRTGLPLLINWNFMILLTISPLTDYSIQLVLNKLKGLFRSYIYLFFKYTIFFDVHIRLKLIV